MMRNSSEFINCDAAGHEFAAPSNRILEPDTESLEELVIELPFIGLSIIDSIPQVLQTLNHSPHCNLLFTEVFDYIELPALLEVLF